MLNRLLCLLLLCTFGHGEEGRHHYKSYIKYSEFYPRFNWSSVPDTELRQAPRVLAATLPQLRVLGAKFNRFIGSQFNIHHLGEKEYVNVHSSQYSMSTTENACKWAGTQPGKDQYALTDCLTGLKYANQTARQSFRGHNLCWGHYNPSWLTNGGYDADQLKSFLQEHINTVAGKVGKEGFVYCWDVVNEALDEHGYKPMDPWYPKLQDYFKIAFDATQKVVDPKTLLFYNDYGGEGMNKKSDTIYKFVQKWHSEGIKVQGIGLQMHVSVKHFPPFDQVEQNMKRLGELGVEVHVTEMDVDCKPCGERELQQQAYIYNGMLKACLNSPKCKNFETWGFTDKYTWRGTDNHPLPFDQYYKPKPAFWSLVKAVNTTN